MLVVKFPRYFVSHMRISTHHFLVFSCIYAGSINLAFSQFSYSIGVSKERWLHLQLVITSFKYFTCLSCKIQNNLENVSSVYSELSRHISQGQQRRYVMLFRLAVLLFWVFYVVNVETFSYVDLHQLVPVS